jgi:hypothetical protein
MTMQARSEPIVVFVDASGDGRSMLPAFESLLSNHSIELKVFGGREPNEGLAVDESGPIDRAVVLVGANERLDAIAERSRLLRLGRWIERFGPERVHICSSGDLPESLRELGLTQLDLSESGIRLLVADDGDDVALGLRKAVLAMKTCLDRERTLLRSFTSRAKLDEPLALRTRDACYVAYSDALNRVHREFRATTRLTSDFWDDEDDMILRANVEMMQRLARTRGRARRLFILNSTPGQFLHKLEDDIFYHLKRRARDKVEDLLRAAPAPMPQPTSTFGGGMRS